MCKYDSRILLKWEYPNDASDIGFTKLLSLRNLPLTAYSSSTICKLCVDVNRFEDCLALLDGRLKQLTTFIVTIQSYDYRTSINYKKVCLDINFFQVKNIVFLFLGSFAEFEILFFEVSLHD